MGYYTRHSLSIAQGGEQISAEDAADLIIKHADYHPFGEPCKWYDHPKYMKWLSKKYPEVVFLLRGEGEDAGDLWREYYLNGKVQRVNATITYDAYDPAQLK